MVEPEQEDEEEKQEYYCNEQFDGFLHQNLVHPLHTFYHNIVKLKHFHTLSQYGLATDICYCKNMILQNPEPVQFHCQGCLPDH